MTDQSDRLSILRKIPPIARIDHRHLIDEEGNFPWAKRYSRKDRRKIEKEARRISRKYSNIICSIYDSGVGFPVDKFIRQMAAEYNNRFASTGTESMPSSFVFFEPFCVAGLIEKSCAPYFKLVPETNHLFSALDFFDYYTSADSGEFDIEELAKLPDGRALHFSNNGILKDISFMDAAGREFLLSGFSMVRRGPSIHWFLVAGELLTEEEWELQQSNPEQIDFDQLLPYKRAFLKECMERSGGATIGAPLPLEGSDTAIRTVVAGEFDIIGRKHVGRMILGEAEHGFFVQTDEPEVLQYIEDVEVRRHVTETAHSRLGEAAALWNLAESLFHLPTYFEARVTITRAMAQKAASVGGIKGKGGRGVKARYEAVEATVVKESITSPSILRVRIPHYSTETGGYWRRLRPGAMGKDREGNPIDGRTWVRQPNARSPNLSRGDVVYVKDRLAAAKIKAETLYEAVTAEAPSRLEDSEESGVLYVLRCATMDGEIYKVGWTSGTASERARSLSSATGVPSAFVVVESWPHDDPEGLETEVHAQLAPYRINERREFFQARFEDIRDIILRTLERV